MPEPSSAPLPHSLEATQQELQLREIIADKSDYFHTVPTAESAADLIASLQAWRSVVQPGSSGSTPAMIRRDAYEEAAHVAESMQLRTTATSPSARRQIAAAIRKLAQ